ncbi:MAG: HTTM domain-containing protein [Polyangiaceae bacterium]|nr:HTTM domain-containing protein [Polyangiaceae bacterium]
MTATENSSGSRLVQRLFERVDIASLAAFRIFFGALMFASVVRFWAYGWIRDIYIAPPFHFHWLGFSWISPWPGVGMYIHFAVLGLASLLVMLGLFYRAGAALFFVTFTYVELVEKATYLNHYYLVSLLSLLMIFMPLHHAASIDALRKPHLRSDTAPAWVLWLLRFQIGIVYFFAGVAKLGPDWLLRGEPLGIWLSAHTGIPIVGPLLAERWVAHAASLFGAAFDLSIVFFLLHARTRPYAYATVVVFHVITGTLFPIGIFPWVMAGSALVFFSPNWPRKLLAKLSWKRNAISENIEITPKEPAYSGRLSRMQRLGVALLCVHVVVQIGLPLRRFLYPGNTAWTEEGFRFAWRVMLVEKMGFVEYHVRDKSTGRAFVVEPSQYLSPLQTKMMSMSPDMILEFAKHIAAEEKRQGRDVEVRADAFVTMNGRPSQRLVDPMVNLAAEEDSLWPKRWILPLKDEINVGYVSQKRH